jgi:indolepyruvate ferredoxin oxidoreductase beta subunit
MATISVDKTTIEDKEDVVEEFNIFVSGVGGQGALTAAGIIARAAKNAGHNVLAAETHGMAQRGGSVSVHLRIGSKVYAPLIPLGRAHVLFSLEPVEAVRYIEYASKDGVAIVNTKPLVPPSVNLGSLSYPSIEQIAEIIKKFVDKVIMIDAYELAVEAGNPLTNNVVMLGAMSHAVNLPITIEELKKSIEATVPEKAIEVNMKAFQLGYDYAEKYMREL